MNEDKSLVTEEIQWPVDDIAVEATLVRPAGAGPYPAIVFVAGSGPTDRNWNSPAIPGSNGSGRLLAHALAAQGFVTVRYDKRASGPHVVENITRLTGKISLQGHVQEVAGAVSALVDRPDVDAARILALTSSEGAIHALNYQRQAAPVDLDRPHRFAGLVLTGVPGRSMADTMRSQIVPQLQQLPDGEQLVHQYDQTIADFSSGRPVEIDPSLPEGLRLVFTALTNPVNQPFSHELLTANPAHLLLDVPEPVLVVIGQKDLQVNWQVDGQALESALAGRDHVTFVYPQDANHVLKYEPKPREQLVPVEVQATYNAADRDLDPEALQAIETWLVRQAGGQAA
jgi:uncharacterized protein